jgi:hypothetical protein
VGPFSPQNAESYRKDGPNDLDLREAAEHYEQQARYTLNRLENFVERTHHPDLQARLAFLQTASQEESRALTQQYEAAQQEAAATNAQASEQRAPHTQRPAPAPLPREQFFQHEARKQQEAHRAAWQQLAEEAKKRTTPEQKQPRQGKTPLRERYEPEPPSPQEPEHDRSR